MARRVNSDRLDACVDAGLLFYLAQYASVCLPGVVGALHPLSIGAVALLIGGAMAVMGKRRDEHMPMPIDSRSAVVVAALATFVLGYVLCLVAYQRQLPVISNDAITYHLPAAVQWLQTGRLGLYPAWFYNPANSYSPLAGSTFIAWLLAPIGNDTLARFVGVGPFLLLFFAMVSVCRRIGADARVAVLIAGAAVLRGRWLGRRSWRRMTCSSPRFSSLPSMRLADNDSQSHSVHGAGRGHRLAAGDKVHRAAVDADPAADARSRLDLAADAHCRRLYRRAGGAVVFAQRFSDRQPDLPDRSDPRRLHDPARHAARSPKRHAHEHRRCMAQSSPVVIMAFLCCSRARWSPAGSEDCL